MHKHIMLAQFGNWCFLVEDETVEAILPLNGPLLGGGRCHDEI